MHAGPLIASVMQALRVLQRVRGTDNVQLEYEDIATASKVAAQVLAPPMPRRVSAKPLLACPQSGSHISQGAVLPREVR